MHGHPIFQCDHAQIAVEFVNKYPMANTPIRLDFPTKGM